VISPAKREPAVTGRDHAEKPHVCFVSPCSATAQLLRGTENTRVGGAEVQITLLASALARRGHAVSCVVAGEPGEAEHISQDGVRVIPAYNPADGAGVSWLTRKWPELWRAMSQANADVYITRGANWHAGAAALFARLHGRSSVFWLASDSDVATADVEGALPFHARVCFRYGFDKCDAIVAQTREQRRLVLERFGREATVIPNMWVPPDGAAPAIARDQREVLWVGNIRPRKRPEMALEVAALVGDAHFTLVGGPVPGVEDLFERVQARAAALANVTLAGHVPHERVHEFYQRASLLLHTSASEGFPNVFLEAWGYGLPVVSTFDPDGVIVQRALGVVGRTAEELAIGIDELLTDGARNQGRAANASRHVRDHHHPDTIAEAAERLLLSLVPHG